MPSHISDGFDDDALHVGVGLNSAKILFKNIHRNKNIIVFQVSVTINIHST